VCSSLLVIYRWGKGDSKRLLLERAGKLNNCFASCKIAFDGWLQKKPKQQA